MYKHLFIIFLALFVSIVESTNSTSLFSVKISNEYYLSWKFIELNVIEFTIEVETQGWVGLGFHGKGRNIYKKFSNLRFVKVEIPCYTQ